MTGVGYSAALRSRTWCCTVPSMALGAARDGTLGWGFGTAGSGQTAKWQCNDATSLVAAPGHDLAVSSAREELHAEYIGRMGCSKYDSGPSFVWVASAKQQFFALHPRNSLCSGGTDAQKWTHLPNDYV